MKPINYFDALPVMSSQFIPPGAVMGENVNFDYEKLEKSIVKYYATLPVKNYVQPDFNFTNAPVQYPPYQISVTGSLNPTTMYPTPAEKAEIILAILLSKVIGTDSSLEFTERPPKVGSVAAEIQFINDKQTQVRVSPEATVAQIVDALYLKLAVHRGKSLK